MGDIHLSHADHSLRRTCAVTIPVVSVLTAPLVLTVTVTIAQYAPVLVASLVTPSSVREESANDTTTAGVTRLAMLTPARTHVTLTWAPCVVIVPSVMLRIINLSALAHQVMMVTHCSHVDQGTASSFTDHRQYKKNKISNSHIRYTRTVTEKNLLLFSKL